MSIDVCGNVVDSSVVVSSVVSCPGVCLAAHRGFKRDIWLENV
jgi:hypothetical protein